MSSEIALPPCLVGFYKQLFPTLDFSRVHFFLGLPFPGPQPMITLPGGHSAINIYMVPEEYKPCTTEGVVSVAHELVHALQIQESLLRGKGVGLFDAFTVEYLSCWTRYWQAENDRNEEDNPFEREANSYEEDLRDAINFAPVGLPCWCDQRGRPVDEIHFLGVKRLYPNLIKEHARQLTPCKGKAGRMLAGFWWDGTADNGFYNILGWTLLGSILGVFLAGPAGAFLGALSGALTGITDELTGIPSLLVSLAAALTGAILNAIVSGVKAAVEFIGGPGDRPLKICFSSDDGDTFDEPIVLGQTSEPPAIAFSTSDIFVAWKNPDAQHNLFVVPASSGGGQPTLTTFGNADGDSGPALAWGNGQLYLLWQREDNKLYVRTSSNGVSFADRVKLGGKVPDDATPGIAYGNRAFAAWIRKKNRKVGIKSSTDGGATWGWEATLNFISHDEGSAALAYWGNTLFLARATSGQREVRVATLGIKSTGDVWVAEDYPVGVRCCDDTGPAVAAGNGFVFVAWIGRGEQHPRLRRLKIAPGGYLSFDKETVLSNERSKDNAGPALAYVENMGGSSILAFAWVRKNT